jgi:hypothetical protein
MFISWQRWLRRMFPLSQRATGKTGNRSTTRPRLEALEDRCLPSVFVVVNTKDSGAGSFRDAINRVNNDPGLGTDTIQFKIKFGTQTVALLSALPTITHSVVIDGTTQNGFAGTPLIELDGAGAGPAANGLTIAAGASTVKGLVVNRFSQDGILLEGKGGDVVEGDYVGTDVTGTVALANGANGVEISGTSNNTVGGTSAQARNLLSGNQGDGVLLSGGAGNAIEGNTIGADATGGKALGNLGRAGVELQGENGDVIGGATPGAGNLISGNSGDGIRSFSSVGVVIAGDAIGTDVTGTKALGNSGNGGVELRGDNNDTVGGTVAAARNLISGNPFGGVTIRATTSVVVEGNSIGTDVTGAKALGNGAGVSVTFGTNTTVGGTSAGSGNLISGNAGGSAILMIFGQDNVVQGNTIGTDLTGAKALGNLSGVALSGESNDRIGGTSPGAGNLISGNLHNGIDVLNNTTGTVVQGNTIGTDVTGAKALGNGGDGLALTGGVSGSVVGGTTAAARNLISGNQADGVLIALGSTGNLLEGNSIGTDVSGTKALGNAGNGVEINAADLTFPGSANNTIGSPVAGGGNLISGNGGDGVFLDSFQSSRLSNTVIQANLIGTDVTGQAALGNGKNGLEMFGGVNNTTVGGAAAAAVNVISANKAAGVLMAGDPALRAPSSNHFLGNKIGTDVTGKAALGNGGDGIDIRGGQGNVIGGSSAGAGNVISANVGDGVFLGPAFFLEASQNVLQGNDIGTDVTGTAALGNGVNGVEVQGIPPEDVFGPISNLIGGASSGARNIISANHADGILIDQNAQQTSVEGNVIGTDVTGAQALGNALNGVDVRSGSALNAIGGAAAGSGNLISANGLDGVRISGSSANTVQGNLIGTDVTGTAALGNGEDGVLIALGFINTIGGATAGAGNTIAFNGNDGVFVNSGTGDLISRNSIFSNGALGIDLNELNNANNSQPAPVLTSAVLVSGTATVQGTLTAAANTTYTIEFFANPTSGFGQGKTFLRSITVTTDASGKASFTVALSGVVSGEFLTATATDPSNDTSEFSNSLAVTG